MNTPPSDEVPGISQDPVSGPGTPGTRDAKNRLEGPSLTLQPLSLWQRVRSNLIQAPLFLVVTSVLGTLSLLISFWDKTGGRQHLTAQFWARTMLRVAGSPLSVIGGDALLEGTIAVYASNHLSYMDTPVVFAALPFQFRILARHNLWKLPFIGWYLNRSGQIPVNADNPRASVSSLNVGVKALKAGMPLVVFPEGGRSVDGHLRPFMSGPAFMAIRAQVPLVPMALVGTHELFPMHTYHFRPRPVKVVFGTPLTTEGLTTRDANALTEKLYTAVAEIYYANCGKSRPNSEGQDSAHE